MSDTINLAGKDIIVDHVTTQDGSDTLRALQLMNAKRNRNGVDGITAGTCRIGARASGTTLDVYAYNPLNAYSTDFGDDYYVNTGYVNCNGQSCPVFIPGKHIGRAMPSGKYGTWAIIIHKASALDEVWSVNVAMPEPDDGVMVWTDWENHVVSIDTDVWVIGSLLFNEDENLTAQISNVFLHSEGQTPETFLKNRFMQIMNDCDGVDTADYTAWAVAMKCDAIFKRMAVLTAFVNYLIANNLKVGPGSGEADSGFRFRCLSDDGNGDPIFDIYFDDKELFKVDISSGKIYFGTGFWYDPDDGAIHSENEQVVINSTGSITAKNATIIGSSVFHGSFDCDVIKTAMISPTPSGSYSASSGNAQAGTLYDSIPGNVPYVGAEGSAESDYIRVRMNDKNGNLTNIAYVKKKIVSQKVGSTYYDSKYLYFYDSGFNQLNIRDYFICTADGATAGDYLLSIYRGSTMAQKTIWHGFYATTTVTVTTLTGGNALEVDIPSYASASSLSTGQLFFGQQTTVGSVTCYPVYMKA